MSRMFFIIALLLTPLQAWNQNPIDRALTRYNSGDIPYVTTEAAAQWLQKDNVVFFDSRSFEEFERSHLPKAQFIGYKEFNPKTIEELNLEKSTPIVVYCSIGVRSEQIGLKLKKLGFQNIYNLYGGIFLWYNENREIVDFKNRPTRAIHGYDKQWAQYIEGGTPSF